MNLIDLDEDVLLQLMDGLAPAEVVRQLQGANCQSNDTLADEAGKAYWSKVIDRVGGFNDWILNEILATPTHKSARQLIGEAAISDMLTDAQLQLAIEKLRESEWSFSQVRGRMLVRRFLAERDISIELPVVDTLLSLGLVWGITELLNTMTVDELRTVLEKATKAIEIPRRARDALTQKIRSQLEFAAERGD